MDITSILCVSYIVLFVGYMNIGIIRDKVSPVVLLSFMTYLTVSYDKNSLFDKILENSMSSVFVSLYLDTTNSYEHLTPTDVNLTPEQMSTLTTKVTNLLAKNVSERTDTAINKFIAEQKKNPELKGLKGEKGDAGGNYVAYQGLYSLSSEEQPVSTENVTNNAKTSNGEGNVIKLRNEASNIHPLKLTDNEQWQFTDNHLINRKTLDDSKSNGRLCNKKGDDKLFLCSNIVWKTLFPYCENLVITSLYMVVLSVSTSIGVAIIMKSYITYYIRLFNYFKS